VKTVTEIPNRSSFVSENMRNNEMEMVGSGNGMEIGKRWWKWKWNDSGFVPLNTCIDRFCLENSDRIPKCHQAAHKPS
jgi:hypothetical protein